MMKFANAFCYVDDDERLDNFMPLKVPTSPAATKISVTIQSNEPLLIGPQKSCHTVRTHGGKGGCYRYLRFLADQGRDRKKGATTQLVERKANLKTGHSLKQNHSIIPSSEINDLMI